MNEIRQISDAKRPIWRNRTGSSPPSGTTFSRAVRPITAAHPVQSLAQNRRHSNVKPNDPSRWSERKRRNFSFIFFPTKKKKKLSFNFFSAADKRLISVMFDVSVRLSKQNVWHAFFVLWRKIRNFHFTSQQELVPTIKFGASKKRARLISFSWRPVSMTRHEIGEN